MARYTDPVQRASRGHGVTLSTNGERHGGPMSATALRTVSAYANHSEEKEPSRSAAGTRNCGSRRPAQTWLTSDVSGVRSQVVALTGPDESEVAINEQLVVEFYSR